MEQQQIEINDQTAYFYLDENGNKIALSKEEYKNLKKQEGYSVNKQTSFHNRATIKRIKTTEGSEEYKYEKGNSNGEMIQIIQQEESKGAAFGARAESFVIGSGAIYFYWDARGQMIEISMEQYMKMS